MVAQYVYKKGAVSTSKVAVSVNYTVSLTLSQRRSYTNIRRFKVAALWSITIAESSIHLMQTFCWWFCKSVQCDAVSYPFMEESLWISLSAVSTSYRFFMEISKTNQVDQVSHNLTPLLNENQLFKRTPSGYRCRLFRVVPLSTLHSVESLS